MKAIHGSFDAYKGVNATMPRWAMNQAGTPPMDAAFHPGAIRYFKEAGLWKPEFDTWQAGMLKRHTTLQAAWKSMMVDDPAARAADLPGLQKIWEARRAKALESA